jgi:hypothetical protein
MKKQLLMLAGSALILASCGSNNNQAQSDQAKLDSISKANAAMQDQLNQKKNDSAINAMAAAKADSIEKATHHESGGSEHKTTHKGGHEGNQPPVTQAPAPTPAPQTGLKAHSDQSQTQQTQTGAKPSGGGLKAHSDQSQNH